MNCGKGKAFPASFPVALQLTLEDRSRKYDRRDAKKGK